MLVKSRGDTYNSAAAVGRIHLVSRERDKVDIIIGVVKVADHIHLSVSDNLSSVDNNLCAVLVSKLSRLVDIVYVACYV